MQEETEKMKNLIDDEDEKVAEEAEREVEIETTLEEPEEREMEMEATPEKKPEEKEESSAPEEQEHEQLPRWENIVENEKGENILENERIGRQQEFKTESTNSSYFTYVLIFLVIIGTLIWPNYQSEKYLKPFKEIKRDN